MESELLRVALKSADSQTHAKILTVFTSYQGNAEFIGIYRSPDDFANAGESVQNFACKAGPIAVWAERSWEGGAVVGGMIYCRAKVDPSEFIDLARVFGLGAQVAQANWLGVPSQ